MLQKKKLTYFSEKIGSLTFDVFLQYIIYDRVDVLIYVLEEEWEAIFDSHLKLLQEVRIIKCAHLVRKKQRNL